MKEIYKSANRVNFILKAEADRTQSAVLKKRLMECIIHLDFIMDQVSIKDQEHALNAELFKEVLDHQDMINLELAINGQTGATEETQGA